MSDFEMTTGYFGPRVRGKLAGQRKARDWSIHPVDDGSIIVQTDGAIGQFDFRTRRGVLNTRGEYFVHLSAALGSESSRGGVTVVNTIRTIG